MKRRLFAKASALSIAATAVLTPILDAKAAVGKDAQEFYELRVYTFNNAAQQELVEQFYNEAAIPSLNRLGIKKVGVFTELKPTGQTKLFIIIPYKRLEEVDKVSLSLAEDSVYQQRGQAYLNAPATAPAYLRIESSLLKAFTHWPKIMTPANNSRIFELRQYQSASEAAGKKKIEMFNDKGEIDIFNRLGFKPVFFAETIIGSFRPNLTYMVTFDDMAAHNAHWKAFGSDPQWKQISTVPEYADSLLVSKITSTFLVPTAFSQI